MKKKTFLISIAVGIFIIALLLSFLLFEDKIIFINVLLLGSFVLIVPYSLYSYFEFRRIEAMEKEFPNFLRDLAEAKRSGLSLLQAISATSKNTYGLLTDEIKKMNTQLSWNIPLEKILEMFRKRLEKSDIINRSVAVLIQTQKSGGKIDEILETLADNIEKLKEVKEEKATLMNQQTMMMYAIFFIFLGICIALMKFLLPLMNMQETGFAISGLQIGINPCSMCVNNKMPSCFNCNIFFTISRVFGFGEVGTPESYFRSLFFSMVMIQAIFTGLIAGEIKSGSVVAGVKHTLIMSVSGFVIFLLAVRVGLI
ncbi:MAG: hypothetical protein DRO96_00875 [Candidatus Aenigmatarchaeota archaeon]|nr:MAG: hypothetical protein DRO96_00875 [Candidatus Aenigmarchaeota archaeon]